MNHQDFALLAGDAVEAFPSCHVKGLCPCLGFIFGNHLIDFLHVGTIRIVLEECGIAVGSLARESQKDYDRRIPNVYAMIPMRMRKRNHWPKFSAPAHVHSSAYRLLQPLGTCLTVWCLCSLRDKYSRHFAPGTSRLNRSTSGGRKMKKLFLPTLALSVATLSVPYISPTGNLGQRARMKRIQS